MWPSIALNTKQTVDEKSIQESDTSKKDLDQFKTNPLSIGAYFATKMNIVKKSFEKTTDEVERTYSSAISVKKCDEAVLFKSKYMKRFKISHQDEQQAKEAKTNENKEESVQDNLTLGLLSKFYLFNFNDLVFNELLFFK